MTLHASEVTAAVFPGQGAQCPGMARDFYERFSTARETFEEASEALGLDLQALCFGQDPRLDLTEFTQPALLTAEIAILRALEHEYGLKPHYFGGHSLGEYTALCAAGVIALADAVQIVRARGALMQRAVPKAEGAMVALIANDILDRRLDPLWSELAIDVANRNASNQLVLSGDAQAIAELIERARPQFCGSDERVVLLNVSAPFHSRLMSGIEDALRDLLATFADRFVVERASSVTSNLTGSFHLSERTTLIEALVRQAAAPVQWVHNMRELASVAPAIVEIGPGRTLRGFFQRTLGLSVRTIGSVRAAEKELAA